MSKTNGIEGAGGNVLRGERDCARGEKSVGIWVDVDGEDYGAEEKGAGDGCWSGPQPISHVPIVPSPRTVFSARQGRG